MTREDIIRAMRSGANTAPAIARFLNTDQYAVSNLLYKMKDIGRVYFGPLKEADGRTGRPSRTFIVNEEWESKRGTPDTLAKVAATKAANPDGEQRRLNGLRAHNATRAKRSAMAKSCEIPAWVLGSHREIYREIAKFLPEQTAAKWARLAKAAK